MGLARQGRDTRRDTRRDKKRREEGTLWGAREGQPVGKFSQQSYTKLRASCDELCFELLLQRMGIMLQASLFLRVSSEPTTPGAMSAAAKPPRVVLRCNCMTKRTKTDAMQLRVCVSILPCVRQGLLLLRIPFSVTAAFS